MNLTPTQRALNTIVQANVPVVVRDDPGTGKTMYIEALARGLGWPLRVVNAYEDEPTDVAGIRIVDEDRVRKLPPSWAVYLTEAHRTSAGAIMFFDDLTLASPSIQGPIMAMARTRRVGEYQLPDTVRWVAATNDPDHVGGYPLTHAMSNRVAHLDWTSGPDQWLDQFPGGYPPIIQPEPLAADWTDRVPTVRAHIAGFLSKHRELVHQCPLDETAGGRPWPSRRSWDLGATLVAAGPHDLQMLLLSTVVGEGPAVEYAAWATNANLPNPKAAINNPEAILSDPGPDGDHISYAIASSIVNVVRSTVGEGPSVWSQAFDALLVIARWAPTVVAGQMVIYGALRPTNVSTTEPQLDFMRRMGKSLGMFT